MRSITSNIQQNYNIFANMAGTPQMQLSKFQGVYDVIKNQVPKNLESLYKETLENFINVLKKHKYLC